MAASIPPLSVGVPGPKEHSSAALEPAIALLDTWLRQLQTANAKAKPALLEEYLANCNPPTQSFATLVSALCQTRLWRSFVIADNPYPALCQALASAVERASQAMVCEPAYHSRGHFKDVCLALSALASQAQALGEQVAPERNWQLGAEDWWVLFFCAIAHDYGHPGTRNRTPFELEKYAVELTQSFLLEVNYPLLKTKSLMADVESIVLATDPRHFEMLRARMHDPKQPATRIERMSMVLVEADLCASALPQRGLELGLQLAKEWEGEDMALAHMVKSPAGRTRFLESIAFYSPYAQHLQLERARTQSILELKDH